MSDINSVARPFNTPGLNTVSIASVTATSARVALSTAGEYGPGAAALGGGPEQCQIYNAGTNPVFVEFGIGSNASSVVALVPNGGTPGSYPVAPGAVVVVSVYGLRAKYAAAICASAQTSTVYFTLGSGT